MSVTVELDPDVFAELQRRATPLVDDTSSVIRRLLAAVPAESSQAGPVQARYANMARGERLPVGIQLRMVVGGKPYYGRVSEEGIQVDGETFPSPSAAARRVRVRAGASEEGANSNGWKTWEYLDERSGDYKPLSELRQGAEDAGTRRRELRSLGSFRSGKGNLSILASDQQPEYPK